MEQTVVRHHPKSETKLIAAVSFGLAFLFLLFFSKDSFLYPMNDWPDVNCFFTLGRGILKGTVPYKDIYEQKGPLLYLIYALAALITEKSFAGIFALEVVFYGLFLFFSGHIFLLSLKDTGRAVLGILVLAALIPASKAFTHGGSAEEMHLWLFSLSLWLILRALEEKRILRFGEAALIGAAFACGLWVKFTFCGFYLGLAVFVIIWYLKAKEGFRGIGKVTGAFFAGAALVSLIPLIYLAANGALGDMFRVYFYNNLFKYPRSSGSIPVRIIRALGVSLKENWIFSLLFIPAAARFVRLLLKKPLVSLVWGLAFAFLAAGTFIGGVYFVYYGLVLAPLAVFGLEELLELFGKFAKKCAFLRKKWVFPAAAVLVFGLLVLTDIRLNKNWPMISADRQDTVQFRFADTIKAKGGKSLLTYNFLDSGFYWASGIEPDTYAFCRFAVYDEDLIADQDRCIEEGLADFVITRQFSLEECAVDGGRYKLAVKEEAFLEGQQFTYYLYEKRE